MPATYHAGLKKHRKTYGIQTCLSTENRTKVEVSIFSQS